LDTAKADLKPPLCSSRRAGCPPWGGIRRAWGEVPGRNRGAEAQGWTGRPRVGQGRACYREAKAFSFTHQKQGDCGRHGTEEWRV